jgi:hypothetical protein
MEFFSGVLAENRMFKAFQILAVALVAIGLAAGNVLAGPDRDTDNGDPDIPSVTFERTHSDVRVDPDVKGQGAAAVGSSRAIDDASQKRWLRVLRTYLRLVRVFGP